MSSRAENRANGRESVCEDDAEARSLSSRAENRANGRESVREDDAEARSLSSHAEYRTNGRESVREDDAEARSLSSSAEYRANGGLAIANLYKTDYLYGAYWRFNGNYWDKNANNNKVMKKHIVFLLFCMTIFCQLHAQTSGLDYYSYPVIVLIDNLPQSIKSEVLDSLYYQKLNDADYTSFVTLDHTNGITKLNVRSKRAKDGFLFVNEYVRDCAARDSLVSLVYVYNDETIKTKKDVSRMLRLRKKRIRVKDIKKDDQTGTITVFVVNKK